ncbi:stage III sporulation protein AG [Alkalicoccobacillus murimartini]|uniref:Stage III sporulation protein AG n=1 Tax=Alkalicoccobacillus murimartini TaxID=171685 RepID=A0ABT9YM84_9BACI|nr:stage III sporulation protein AG [Alkalicoccobacillus murimartini]MDQ0208967.1 stage III sporulation protein AG [Alkalicoccobacillus murimartini]
MKQDHPKGFAWLKKLLEKSEPGKRKNYRYIVILGCAGILLMVLNQVFSAPPDSQQVESVLPAFQSDDTEEEVEVFKKESGEPNTMKDYEDSYENQLRETLEQIVGLNDVSVMINLAETEKQIYEKNTSSKNQQTSETDREGGTREVTDQTIDEQTVIVRNGDTEEPLLIQTEKPSIKGVLVVAEGVENAQVKAWVLESVSRVLDVPVHRISVMPKKSKEE